MKKIVITIFVVLIIIAMSSLSQATTIEKNPNIPITLTGTKEIAQDKNTVDIILSLGEFTDIPEEPLMGYEAILEYDKNIFSSVAVEGLNNWNASYEEDTGRLMGEILTVGEQNKQITKITFTLKENATIGTTTVRLTSGLLTVNDEIDFEFEKEIPITIIEKTEEEDQNENTNSSDNTTEDTTENTEQNETGNTAENETQTNSSNQNNTVKNANQDKTTASKKLPKTGM